MASIPIAALRLVCLLAFGTVSAAAGEFAGPVAVTALSVYDGDTFLADAHIWPGQTIRVNIRIRGIDAPELRARCEAERGAAHRARDGLAALVAGESVSISNIGGAKYYGRVLADVTTASGSVAEALLAAGLARPYSGGRRRSFC